AAPLQHDQAARLTWIQATSTGGVRARLRRVAGCATPSGSAGHAGETANFKLTFHLDHSAGADQLGLEPANRRQPLAGSLILSDCNLTNKEKARECRLFVDRRVL